MSLKTTNVGARPDIRDDPTRPHNLLLNLVATLIDGFGNVKDGERTRHVEKQRQFGQMRAGTDALPEPEDELERIELRLGAEMAGWVKVEWIGVHVCVVCHCPAINTG